MGLIKNCDNLSKIQPSSNIVYLSWSILPLVEELGVLMQHEQTTGSILSNQNMPKVARSENFMGATTKENMVTQENSQLQNLLHGVIEKARAENVTGALLFVKISNMAMIINGYGRDVSEQVIQDLMARIQLIVNPKDIFERIARDEFAIIASDRPAEETERLAIRISNVILNYGRDNFATAALHVMGNVSSVLFPDEASNEVDALDKAYAALHATTDNIYKPYAIAKAEADQCRQQMGLASYLHSAFRENRLRLAWQPILDVANHKIAHYEALLRIKSATGKISSAGALIPVAEKMGLIDDIDMLVMEMVVRELRNSKTASLAFNVSNMTTENRIWLDRLSELVEETPEIASRMMVEITETAAQRDLRKAAYFVASLQSMGAQVALDDFGSGYTSFRQLKALSVDLVKIDGVFIKDIAINADSRFFVKTLLDFSRGFGLKAVAEFVENGEIAKILIDMGVDYLQGYYLGKPENTRGWMSEGEYKAD